MAKTTAKTSVKSATKPTEKVAAAKMVKKVDKPMKSEEEILFQVFRGMRDILSDEQLYWERVRRVLTHA